MASRPATDRKPQAHSNSIVMGNIHLHGSAIRGYLHFLCLAAWARGFDMQQRVCSAPAALEVQIGWWGRDPARLPVMDGRTVCVVGGWWLEPGVPPPAQTWNGGGSDLS